MIDYPLAQAVALVAQTGSFEGAARVLSVTPSAVSQRVKLLEERMGVVLIERGAPCSATAQGEWLCRHIEHVGILEEELKRHLPGLIDRDALLQKVTLNLAVNADSLGTWFMEAASAFSGCSDYLMRISVDDEDHTAEWLQKGRVVAAVTSLEKPVQGCRVIPLGKLRYCATASPAYFERYFAGGVTPATVAKAPGLTFNQKDTLQGEWLRRSLGKNISYPTHWVPSTTSFVEASLAGMGWGMNPLQLVKDHLAAGRLVELLPESRLDVPLFWQINRLTAEHLEELTRVVVSAAKKHLIPVTC